MFVTNTVQLASSALPASKKNNLNITNERKSYNSKSVSLPLPYHFTSFITISSNILCVEMHQKLIEYASTERPWVSILSRAKQNEAAHWDFLPKFLSLHYRTTLEPEGVMGVATEQIVGVGNGSYEGPSAVIAFWIGVSCGGGGCGREGL